MQNKPGVNTGFFQIIAVALPLSLGAFVQFLVLLTDNYFLSQVSEAAINGAGIAAMIYITATMFAAGLASGTQIFIARKFGENKSTELSAYFAGGLSSGIVLSLSLVGLLYLVARYFLGSWLSDPAIFKVAQEFLNIRLIGFVFYAVTLTFVAFYVGITKTSILVFSTLLTSVINIVLDYALIFGNLGLPEMGSNGAALATVVAEFIGTGFLVSYTFGVGYGKTFGLLKSIFNKPFKKSRDIFKLSIPLMFQQVLALATWTLFFFMVEKIGGTALKVCNVIRSFYMLAFVIVMGVGQTARTYVSSLIAENRQSDLRSTLWKLIGINVLGVSILCHGFILYPSFISSFFFDDPEKGVQLVKSLRVIFLSVVIFSFGSVWLNAIEGSGKTKIALAAELASIVVYLLLVYQLTIVHPQPIHIVWMSDYLYFGVLAGISGLFLVFGNWKHNTI